MAGERPALPDVRVGDVWRDNDPRGGPGVKVKVLCAEDDHRCPAVPPIPRAHAHVVDAATGKRPRTITWSRFVPTRRGYWLYSRGGRVVPPEPAVPRITEDQVAVVHAALRSMLHGDPVSQFNLTSKEWQTVRRLLPELTAYLAQKSRIDEVLSGG